MPNQSLSTQPPRFRQVSALMQNEAAFRGGSPFDHTQRFLNHPTPPARIAQAARAPQLSIPPGINIPSEAPAVVHFSARPKIPNSPLAVGSPAQVQLERSAPFPYDHHISPHAGGLPPRKANFTLPQPDHTGRSRDSLSRAHIGLPSRHLGSANYTKHKWNNAHQRRVQKLNHRAQLSVPRIPIIRSEDLHLKHAVAPAIRSRTAIPIIDRNESFLYRRAVKYGVRMAEVDGTDKLEALMSTLRKAEGLTKVRGQTSASSNAQSVASKAEVIDLTGPLPSHVVP